MSAIHPDDTDDTDKNQSENKRRIASDHTPEYQVGDPIPTEFVGVSRDGKLAIGEKSDKETWVRVNLDSVFAIVNIREHR